jgi:ankyrin repeat protein
VFCNLLRQLLTIDDSTGVCEIPEEIIKLWNKSRSIERGSLSEGQARNLLGDQISRFTTIFLVIDAVDEAEGCEDNIDDEIKQLRSLGVCILTTDRMESRTTYEAAYCQECGDPLELAWLCRTCRGHFGGNTWLCRMCYSVKGIRCSNADHVMTPPERVNVEISASQGNIEDLVTRFLSDTFSGGDIGGDDDMFSGNIPLLRLLKDKMDPEFWDSLPSKVGKAAEGNFLYARLFLDQLRLQRNKAGILSITQQLESGRLKNFENQYEAMLTLCLEKNDKYGAQVAQDHLSMVASAYEVLTFEQLSHATAISPNDRVLDDFTGRTCSKQTVRRDTQGLLTLSYTGAADSFPVSFFHRSLTTYMEEHLSRWFPEASQSIFEACVSYLGLDVFASPLTSRKELDNALQEHPFATYAACYWGSHACDTQDTAGNCLRVLKFLHDRDRLDCAMQISWHARSLEEDRWDVPAGITPLHFCAFYGLEMQCQAITTFDPVEVLTGEDSYDQTPLIYACRNRHMEVARLLLDAGADPNHLSIKGKSPLIEAIERFDLGNIDLLLGRDDIDVNVRAPGRQGTTALIRAAALGQESVVEKLLAIPDIDVNKPDGLGCTAISRAVQRARKGCVDLLLRCSATDLTLADQLGHRSPLDWTAEESVVGSGIATEEIYSVADVLLADRRRPRPSNKAVSLAISQGRVGLLEVFIKHNSLDWTYKDEHGRNLVHLAACTGNIAVLQLVFNQLSSSQSFQIDSLDNHKSSALHLACRYTSREAHVETIEFLLDAGADPNLEDSDGLRTMARARHASPSLWNSHVRAVFEARGVEVAGMMNDLRPKLSSAILTESISVVEAELARSSGPLDPEIDVYTGETLLWRAIESEEPYNVELLKLLLPRSTQFLSNRCNKGHTCAHLAVMKCSPAALGLLADAGIDLDAKNKWGMTALQVAHNRSRYEMCIQLISKGAELPPAHEIRPALLQAAVASGDAKPVSRLLAAGIDVRHRDEESGMTALQAAERLLEDAQRDVNIDLINQWNSAIMVTSEVFDAEIAKAPEVIRRKKVRDLLRDAQKPYPARSGDESRVSSHGALGKALTALEKMDSNRILTPKDWLELAAKDHELRHLHGTGAEVPGTGSLPASQAAVRLGRTWGQQQQQTSSVGVSTGATLAYRGAR